MEGKFQVYFVFKPFPEEVKIYDYRGCENHNQKVFQLSQIELRKVPKFMCVRNRVNPFMDSISA